jgi:hypothetical protein
MEYFIGLIMLVASISLIIFFKSTIKKSALYVDSVVSTNISESQKDLIIRSQNAYNNLIEEVGEDFKTPEEIYNQIFKKNRKKKTNTGS